MNSVFESAIKATSSGKIGTPKMIRIEQTCFPEDMPHKEAMQCCLYYDLKLSIDQLGDVAEIFAKSKSYTNTIVSLRHKNRCMSHFSINFTSKSCPPLLHLEIAGDGGLLNFDSNKGTPVTISTGGYSYWSADLKSMSKEAEADNGQNIKELISQVTDSIEKGSVIRRHTGI